MSLGRGLRMFAACTALTTAIGTALSAAAVAADSPAAAQGATPTLVTTTVSKSNKVDTGWARYNAFEVKLGALEHDIGFLGSDKEDGQDISIEFLSKAPRFLRFLWLPRPHLGADINTGHGTSAVYAGLTWDIPLFSSVFGYQDGIFLEPSFGPSWNNGIINTTNPKRKSLGSNILFRESLGIGYNLTAHNNVSLFIDHISNGRLAERNEGITSVGLRFGYRF